MTVDARLNVNVALNRPSYQSSTWGDWTAKLANDGSHNTDIRSPPHCAHTNSDVNPWWAVDLGIALYVFGVKFTNRGGVDGEFEGEYLSLRLRCDLIEAFNLFMGLSN